MDGFPTVKDSLSSLHIVQKHSVSSEGNHISQRGQVRSWLFCSSSSILRALRAILLSAPTLAFILKHTELTDEVFSNPSTLPISPRSEEHTSELQSQFHLVCTLL